MPTVVDMNGNTLAHVDDNLLNDFFFDMLLVGKACHDIAGYLTDLEPYARLRLSQYIVERLAEVDPGYVPRVEDNG